LFTATEVTTSLFIFPQFGMASIKAIFLFLVLFAISQAWKTNGTFLDTEMDQSGRKSLISWQASGSDRVIRCAAELMRRKR
ncbi:hypothetical protein PFISCL1PPCAC_9358, partial [Pristionchus fissidentatus]